jgi:hypothetical protein
MTEVIAVTKMDAARRQLGTALDLWFAEGDPVSIHTLAHASHEIIHRLYRNAGHTDLLFDSSIVEPEHAADFSRFLKDSARFIKHAKQERSPDDSIDFNPALNEIFLAMSVIALERMGKGLDGKESAMRLWFAVHHPRPQSPEYIRPIYLEALQALGRPDFLKYFLENLSGGKIK